MSAKPEILVVDDDQGFRRALQLMLRGHGYSVKAYSEPALVEADPDARQASILVADFCMPGATGIELLRRLRNQGWMGSAVLVTGYGSEELAKAANAEGFDVMLDKPLRPNLLLQAIEAAGR